MKVIHFELFRCFTLISSQISSNNQVTTATQLAKKLISLITNNAAKKNSPGIEKIINSAIAIIEYTTKNKKIDPNILAKQLTEVIQKDLPTQTDFERVTKKYKVFLPLHEDIPRSQIRHRTFLNMLLFPEQKYYQRKQPNSICVKKFFNI